MSSSSDPDVSAVAGALHTSFSLLFRRLRQSKADGDLTLPESAALVRLDRGGSATPTALAKAEQISTQSMGATIATLEARGLVERRPDPHDGRQAIISVTENGQQTLRNRRNARTDQLADALASEFTRAELKQLLAAAPLIERLAQSF